MKEFYWQERIWTCGPAALRIALAKLKIKKIRRISWKNSSNKYENWNGQQ